MNRFNHGVSCRSERIQQNLGIIRVNNFNNMNSSEAVAVLTTENTGRDQ